MKNKIIQQVTKNHKALICLKGEEDSKFQDALRELNYLSKNLFIQSGFYKKDRLSIQYIKSFGEPFALIVGKKDTKKGELLNALAPLDITNLNDSKVLTLIF